LRRSVTNAAIVGSHLGLMLLLREGLAGWAERRSEWLLARAAPAASVGSAAVANGALPSSTAPPFFGDLVKVVANMILPLTPEFHA
jgi:hypothetical protein